MGGGSRGKPKPTLRDIARIIPTHDQTTEAIITAAKSDSPIATAIIGATLIERELEIMLRARFARSDDETWKRLVGDNGPIGTLDRKIVTAHAMRLCNDLVKSNLDIIRNIRNAFAHAKIMVTFDDPLVVSALQGIKLPESKRTRLYKELIGLTKIKEPKHKFLSLCLAMSGELIRRQNIGMAVGTRNVRRGIVRLKRLSLAAGLLSYPGYGYADLLKEDPIDPQAPRGLRRTFDPKIQLGPGPMSLARAQALDERDNKDKE